MRKAYRRRGGKGRKLFYGTLVLVCLAVLTGTTAIAVSRLQSGLALSDWDDGWLFAVFALFFGLSISLSVLLVRGPQGPGADEASGSSAFPSSRSVAIGEVVVSATLALCAGVIALMVPVEGGTWTLLLVIGALAGLPLASMLRNLSAMRRSFCLVVDSEGIRLTGGRKGSIHWRDIDQIRSRRQSGLWFDPEWDAIDVQLRQEEAAASADSESAEPRHGARKARVVTLWAWAHFGVSPAVILDGLDRFRPSTVPIHDPRRIVESDDDRSQTERHNG